MSVNVLRVSALLVVIGAVRDHNGWNVSSSRQSVKLSKR